MSPGQINALEVPFFSQQNNSTSLRKKYLTSYFSDPRSVELHEKFQEENTRCER